MMEKMMRQGKRRILVYGIEKTGLTLPDREVDTEDYQLEFKSFDADSPFTDYDGVILFQGIFERFDILTRFLEPALHHHCFKNELRKRKIETAYLAEKDGFICSLLIVPFIERENQSIMTVKIDYGDTDLVKVLLNHYHVNRKNFDTQQSSLSTIPGDFTEFLSRYGAAWSHFTFQDLPPSLEVVSKVHDKVTGFIVEDTIFFIPSLVPENTPDSIKEFFTLLGDAIRSRLDKNNR